MFEVTKADDNSSPSGSAGASSSPPPSPTVAPNPQQSALRVIIPTELQGVGAIMVLCRKGTVNIVHRIECLMSRVAI